jgi:hypothetical protein
MGRHGRPGELAQVEGTEHRKRARAFLGDWTLQAGTSRHRGAVRGSLGPPCHHGASYPGSTPIRLSTRRS